MKRLLPLLLLGAACAAPKPIRVSYRPEGEPRPVAKAPILYIDVSDKSGGVKFEAPEQVPVERSPAEILREALGVELQRAGIPYAQDPKAAQARLAVSLEEAKVSWKPGYKTTLRGETRVSMSLMLLDGKELWSSSVSGARERLSMGGHAGKAGSVLEGAFFEAMQEIRSQLTEDAFKDVPRGGKR